MVTLIAALTLGRQVPAAPVLRDLHSDEWVAQDDLGRGVMPSKLGTVRHDRVVGMFYFLANHVPGAAIFDNTKLLAANPQNPAYGPFGTGHWWGEPWFGYYQSDDRAVIRKHMQMLTDVGVDFLVFDATNGPTYPDVYVPMFEEMEKMRSEGNRVPQIAFFCGHGAWNTVSADLYSKGLFSDLWFRWKGKPLIMIHRETGDQIPPEVGKRFTVRESWAWAPSEWFGDGHDKWPWLDNYPQHFGWDSNPSTPEEMSVAVGQHATSTIGRSSLSQHEPPVDDQRLTPETPLGRCFAQQFERAIQVDPPVIFITGWNEWTATRFRQDQAGMFAGKPNPAGGSLFVDEYNAEFSRDIEPAKGLLGDNYYLQLADYVRRYKGGRAPHSVSWKHLKWGANVDQWKDVQPEYLDDVGDPVERNHPGWGTLRYENHSGRNDIDRCKVAEDRANLYFFVRTVHTLSPRTDPNWMVLYLNTDANYETGWLGYDFIVDREIHGDRASLEKNVGNAFKWKKIGVVRLKTEADSLMIEVPKRLIGLKASQRAVDFKWADNVPQTGEVASFTTDGDTAPNDRFNFRAVLNGQR